MINLNGTLQDLNINHFNVENRGFKYGDALFETLKVVEGSILFWEDHYFRLMASMRILRMDIPMTYTMAFLESEILKTIKSNHLLDKVARVRLDIFRGNGGFYLPNSTPNIVFSISASALQEKHYTINESNSCVVDLYKDYYLAPNLISGLKTNNKILNVLGSIYAKENALDNCLVLNTNKAVIEALNGNLFLLKGDSIITPPLEDGSLRGVLRKQLLKLLVKDVNLDVKEASISPFELQKADELFITNVIRGITPITQYRKKKYGSAFAKTLVAKLNETLF